MSKIQTPHLIKSIHLPIFVLFFQENEIQISSRHDAGSDRESSPLETGGRTGDRAADGYSLSLGAPSQLINNTTFSSKILSFHYFVIH